MGQGRQLVWGLVTPHHSGAQSLFDPWSVFSRMRGAAHPAMAPASTPKATSSRALLGISHDQTSDSCHICPTAATAQISKRALTWQWHSGWTQRCCPMAYRQTANRFPYQPAENHAAFYRPNLTGALNKSSLGESHTCKTSLIGILVAITGSVYIAVIDGTCWNQRHCGSNTLLTWPLRQHHALPNATFLLADYF